MIRTPAGPGYSTRYPHIDFETYSEAGLVWNPALGKWDPLPGVGAQKRGLKATGAHAYTEHPTFEILMLAYDLQDGAGPRQWLPGQPAPADLLSYVAAGGIVEAHNAQFEYWCWQWATRVWGWVPLRMEQLRCSTAKARAFSLPGSLGDLSDVLQLTNGKLADGKRLIDKWTMPRKPTNGNPRLRLVPADDPADWEKFKAYNVRDIVAECEASDRIPDLSPMELEYWQCDQRINDRGVYVDLAAIEDCIAIVEQAFAKYNAELRTLAGCDASELAQLGAWCDRQGVSMPSMAEEHITSTLERPDLPAGVRRALEIRQLIGSASVKKLFAIRAATSSDSRLRGLYSYHAGRTGRWAGMGPQPQNLFSSSWDDAAVELGLSRIATRCLELVEYFYGNALDAVCQCLRGLFCAAPGCELIGSDYRGIENVVAAGLAGETWVLDVYRTHGLIYEATASAITGIPLQAYIDHKKRTGEHHPTRQTLGKPGALGCLTAETQVLTARGYVSIVDVRSDDLLWDGQEWTTHGGVVEKGCREVIYVDGVGMTPNHKINLSGFWKAAGQVVLSNEYRTLALATGLEALRCWGRQFTESENVPSPYSAIVERFPILAPFQIYLRALHEAAPRVGAKRPSLRPASPGEVMPTRWPMTGTGKDCLTGFPALSGAATIRATPNGTITGSEGFPYSTNGGRTAARFSLMSKLCRGGMTRVWKWIAKTLTTVINPETFGLLRNEKTPSTSGKSLTSRPVYDILNCGSRHCFLVKSNSGHLLVHNSQFGGWIGAWKNFGAGEFLSDEEIKSAILAWRAKSPNIVEMWGGQTRNRFGRGGTEYAELYGLEGAAIAAVKYSGQSFHYRQIAYQVHGDALYCRLPSGRLLTYHEPRLRPSTREYARPWELELSFMGWNSNPTKGAMGWLRMYLYGGLAFENVTQATARDPLAGALVRLERSGYPVVLHTHDEPVAELPEGFGSVAEFEGLMVPPDDWCRGWPIVAAGGWRGRRYG